MKHPSYNSKDRNAIRNYYSNWNYDCQDIDLRFRGIKIMGLVRTIKKRKTKWHISWSWLQKTINKRRVNNNNIAIHLRQYINTRRFPLRVFMTSVEFFDPRALGKRRLGYPRILRSGIVSFEEDSSLQSSIHTALILSDVLKNMQHKFVFTGNKSIHVWVLDFKWEEWVPKKYLVRNYYKAHLREVSEYLARKNFFEWVAETSGVKNLDRSTTTDTRRVIPVLDTLNALTWRKVIELNRKELELDDPNYIQGVANVRSLIGDGLPRRAG